MPYFDIVLTNTKEFMKLLSRVTTFSATLLAAATFTTTSAAALTVEQSQELNNSAKTSVTCNGGTCSGSAEASQNGKQSQKVEVPTPTYSTGHSTVYRYRRAKTYWVPSTVVMMADGQVRLSWGMRGGTCHVRYTEANQGYWKYETSAGCDDGGVTIGGLQPGVKYKFQVRQDNGAWSRVMVGVAR
jgi:hypothetical protein